MTGDPVNSGIGFSVSVNIIKRVVPFLIEDGYYDYPYIGVSAIPELSLMQLEELGIDHTTGAYIVLVVEGSPADEAGLQSGVATDVLDELPKGGDLIIGVDGRPVRIFGDLLSYMMINKSPGDEMVLDIIRDGEEMQVVVVLGKRP